MPVSPVRDEPTHRDEKADSDIGSIHNLASQQPPKGESSDITGNIFEALDFQHIVKCHLSSNDSKLLRGQGSTEGS
jgi:hypothetical protein